MTFIYTTNEIDYSGGYDMAYPVVARYQDHVNLWRNMLYAPEEGWYQALQEVAVNTAGDIFVCGKWNYPLGGYNTKDMAKWDVSGNVIWDVPLIVGGLGNGIWTIAACPGTQGNCVVGTDRVDDDYSVYYVQGSTGGVLWKKDTGGDVACVRTDYHGNVYALSGAAGVWAWDNTGALLWTQAALNIPTLLVLNGGGLFYASLESDYVFVHKYSCDDGEEIVSGNFPIGQRPGDPWNQAGIPLAVDEMGTIYVRSAAPGGDTLLRAYDYLGSFLWETTFTPTGTGNAGTVKVDDHYLYMLETYPDDSTHYIHRYGRATGVESSGDWPAATWSGPHGLDISPGLVGAFRNSWFPAPHIYVGNARYE